MAESGNEQAKPVTRRAVLGVLGSVGAAAATPRWLRAQGAGKRLELEVHGAEVLAKMPANFTGLSYEAAQLTHPEFFTGANADLIALVRTLGSRGVLRIGGNTSAFTAFTTRTRNTPETGGTAGYGPDKGGRPAQVPGMYKITPRAIDNLRAFLDKTGRELLYGLNLRHGTPEAAAEEAAYVARVCGEKLLALQFGNEPDLFNHSEHDESGKGGAATRWSYAEFLAKWKAMYKAVHARVPGVEIAGPDSAFNKEWAGRFAGDTRGEVGLLTTHYYAEGPPTDPRMTIDLLLHPGQRLGDEVYTAMAAAKAAGLPFRMSEGNSCYNGGKPGVSDTFASALWAGDFMLDLGARGATGVNLHGGGEGVYTPIATGQDGRSSARPEFYGMWLAGQFAGRSMVRAELGLAAKVSNVTAYAATGGEGMLAAVFNKGQEAVEIGLRGLAGTGKGEVFALTAPTLASTSGVEFGKGAREAGSVWTLEATGALRKSAVRVKGGSAVLVRA